MSGRLDIASLCGKYRNEDAHSRHVAALTLQLFDQARSQLGIPAADRRVLEAAALLHDIGFGVAPDDHARAGAEIVLREGLPDLTPVQRQRAAAAILLHASRYKPLLRSQLLTELDNRKPALRLAAILRIGDGLDHGHVQDTVIRSVEFRGGCMVVRAACRAYALSAVRAEAKSDLFRETFGIGVSVAVPTAREVPLLLKSVVKADTNALSAARLILASQYRAMVDEEANTIAGGDPEYLHDLRVAVRRFRFALRFFRPLLNETSAMTCEAEVAELCRRLGPARDAQVWLAFVEETMARLGREEHPGWLGYLEETRATERREFRGLRRILRGSAYRGTARHMASLVRAEMPALERHGPAGHFGAFAVKRLRKLYRRLQKTRLEFQDLAPERLHDVRKDCRRERYGAEFAAGALGSAVFNLSKQLRVLTNTLGTVHDMDIRLEASREGTHALPPGLRKVMRSIRSDALKEFRSGWKGMHTKRCRRAVQKAFKRNG
jgi:CHAD domain-containing protein